MSNQITQNKIDCNSCFVFWFDIVNKTLHVIRQFFKIIKYENKIQNKSEDCADY